jgi:3-hydroxyisobutyrate dehydrogenase-like beta-hydroxyacid dehydrogenase
MAQTIGVLGVGRMGAPIAARLAAAGHDVLRFDIDPLRGGPTDVATVDVLVTVLPGVAELEAVAPSVVAALAPGSLWIDLTSGDPRMSERLARPDIDVVVAPMGGGVAAAESGSLALFVGGSPTAVGRARPLLETLGTIDHVGEGVGDGQTAKLLANLLWFGQVVAVSEALLLGQSLGVAPARLREILAGSAGGSVFIDDYLDALLDGDYLESFGIDRVVEELDTLASLARTARVPFELSSLVERLHRDALERFGAVDGELLAAKLLEERAGRTLRRD